MKYILSTLATLLLCSALNARSVYIIPINGMIDLGLSPYIDRVLHDAQEDSALAVIFKINTFGGRVDAAVKIKDAILNTPLVTYAFVDKRAISAGALISLSADTIIMSRGASIGAATPVDGKGKKLSEKQVSYMRAEMRATAEKNNRSPLIAEAMVDESITIKDLSAEGKLLTLTTEEALKNGIADYKVDDLEELLKKAGLTDAPHIYASENWAEKLVRVLSHPAISSLLMTIGMLGIIFEIKTPGWGVGGTLGLGALMFFFGSHYLVHLAGWGELLLFAAGLLFIILEIFVVPGFGITGILGILALATSFILSFLGHLPSQSDLFIALLSVVSALTATLVGTIFFFKRLPRIGPFKKLILTSTVSAPHKVATTPPPLTIGDCGITTSDLRPSGNAQFEHHLQDVITQGEYIKQGIDIEITEVHGNRIVVHQKHSF